MAISLITPPAVQPVSLADAKAHLRVEHADDDAHLTALIAQATTHLEALSGLKLITQTHRVYFDLAPGDRIFELPLRPIQSVAEARIFDAAGDPVIADLTDAELDRFAFPGRLLISEVLCPADRFNGIEIDVVAGFGVAGSDVPGNLMRALMTIIAHWYEFRGAIEPADPTLPDPAGLERLIAPYRSRRL